MKPLCRDRSGIGRWGIDVGVEDSAVLGATAERLSLIGQSYAN